MEPEGQLTTSQEPSPLVALLGQMNTAHNASPKTFKVHDSTVSYLPALRGVDDAKGILLELRAGGHLEL
jgi:hypothetical protein